MSDCTQLNMSGKIICLVDSLIKCIAVSFKLSGFSTILFRDKNTTPSGFTLKLRKHIRTRRLEDVRQLGYDRVITFSCI